MMLPNQIKMQSFSPAGRGAYKSAEVDSFVQKLYVSYNELYSENAELKKKFASLRDIIEEYNAGKNAIATAIVKAQTVADQTVESAKNAYDAMLADGERKAQALVDEKVAEATTYAEEVRRKADEYFEETKEEAKLESENLKQKAKEQYDEAAEKAKELIDDANNKAAAIVAAAYGDAKKAQEKRDELLCEAKNQLDTIKAQFLTFKSDSIELMKDLLPKLEALTVPEIEIEEKEAVAESEPVVEVQPEPETKLDVSEIGEDRTTVVKEEKAEPNLAYIPDAGEYVKQIFDSIVIPGASEIKTEVEPNVFETYKTEKKAERGFGYNGNKTSFSVTDDIDILSDDE